MRDAQSEQVQRNPPVDVHDDDDESQFAGGHMPASALPLPTKPPIVQYAAAPEADGFFKVNQLSSEPGYKMLYRLSIEGEGDEAALDLLPNSDQFATAIQSPPRYLDPACKYSQPPGPGASTIVEVDAGRVRLEEGRWVVFRKIDVEFH
jgi:hypothetical protein